MARVRTIGGCLRLAALTAVVSAAATAATWHPAVGPGPHPLLPGGEPPTWGDDIAWRRAPAKLRDAILDLAEHADSAAQHPLVIDYPLADAMFPPGFPPPTFVWHDAALDADTWFVTVRLGQPDGQVHLLVPGNAVRAWNTADPAELSEDARNYVPPPYDQCELRWRPSAKLWQAIQRASQAAPVSVSICGFSSATPTQILSSGTVAFRSSVDPVEAPIFYREVPLPFIYAVHNLGLIRYQLGSVTSPNPPRTLLTHMDLCGNCHSFTPDGKTLAMDVDYGSDKGSYIITDVQPTTLLKSEDVISWTDFRRDDGKLTFGLLSQISPCGRYVISTVKDRSVFSPVPDFYYSQRFFPVTGILVVYDREKRAYTALEGAADPQYVQSNPAWSPDGKTLLFCRADAYPLVHLKNQHAAVVPPEEVKEFFEGGKIFRYDIYTVPFNDGRGGDAVPLPGASGNGKSNFFPKYSPDGKWIVFCKAHTFMLLQPDSALYIMPAAGGVPKLMRCNLDGKMNSWHSWSPDGRWLVFASKAAGPFTQLWLTHVDPDGQDSRPVLLERLTCSDRAANIPEFVNLDMAQFTAIEQAFDDYYKPYRQGRLHQKFGRSAQAIPVYLKALAIKPDHPDSLYFLALALEATGRRAEAIPYSEKLVKVLPGSMLARRLLAFQLLREKRHREALTHFELILRRLPRDGDAANALAWLLATAPEADLRDPERAVALAQAVVSAQEEPAPAHLDTLAAAFAESGQFEQALAVMRYAFQRLRDLPQLDRTPYIAHMQALQQGQPIRDLPGTAVPLPPALGSMRP